jgi:transposase
VEIANLQLKVRALELAQAKQAKEEDERQQYLHIEHTESVRVDCEDDSDPDDEDDSQQETPQIPSSNTKRKGKKRIRIEEKLKGLAVIQETVRIPDEVKASPDQWEEIGEVVTEEVLVVPTKLGRHLIRSKKYRNKEDRTSAPIMAKAPIRFSSSYVSASLAIYIVLSKYLDHSTLYRLEKKFERMGLEMTRQSQSDAVERMSEWLRPLYELMDQYAKASGYLQIDETFIKYINGNKPGGGQGYFWAIHAPGQSIVLKWIDNRRHENVEPLIEGFDGILQSDGYAAYGNYAQTHPEVTLAACWAHSFRKFRDALEHEPVHAKAMMRLISDLYDLEEKWDLADVSPSKRKLLRQTESIPIAEKIKAKLDAYAVDMTIPKNDFRIALNYMSNQWTALVQCLQHGHTRLDTNLLESKFRPTKIGAKNWMFIPDYALEFFDLP